MRLPADFSHSPYGEKFYKYDRFNDSMAKQIPPVLKSLWAYFHFKLDTLSDRIQVQKVVYLLKEMGFEGLEVYTYSMYIYGPYSSDLAKDVFSLRDNPLAVSEVEFSESQKKYITELERSFNLFDEQNNSLGSAVKYELFADCLFFHKKGQAKDDVLATLSNKHAYLGDKVRFGLAWDILSKMDLVR